MNWLKSSIITIRLIENRKVARVLWGCLVALGITVILYRIIVEWRMIVNARLYFDEKKFLYALGIYSFGLILTASGWALIMNVVGDKLNFWGHIRNYCLSNVAQRLPTPLPFILARTEAYSSLGVPRKITILAMTLEISFTLAGAFLVGTSVVFLYKLICNELLRYLIYFLSLLIVFLVFSPKKIIFTLSRIIGYDYEKSFDIYISYKNTTIWLLIYILIWVNNGLFLYTLYSSFYLIPKEYLIYLVLISAISGIVGWLGQFLFFVRQLTMVYLLGLLFPMPLAVVFSLLSRVIVMIFELLWVGIFIMVPRLNQNNPLS